MVGCPKIKGQFPFYQKYVKGPEGERASKWRFSMNSCLYEIYYEFGVLFRKLSYLWSGPKKNKSNQSLIILLQDFFLRTIIAANIHFNDNFLYIFI